MGPLLRAEPSPPGGIRELHMEFVFVVPRGELFRDAYPQGLVPFGDAFPEQAFEATVRRHGFFVQREHAEQNPLLKQVIPYSVVLRGSEVLLLRRTHKGGESRLHNKLSIGVGGHINPQDAPEIPSSVALDAPRFATIENGSRRELDEELRLELPPVIRRVGILNDDSNPVGAVHVGLVQLAFARGDVSVREEDQLEGRFVAPDELRRLHAQGANFETWSAKLIERLSDWLAIATPDESASLQGSNLQ
jgi:predicted NUDIX family phosphoesterase